MCALPTKLFGTTGFTAACSRPSFPLTNTLSIQSNRQLDASLKEPVLACKCFIVTQFIGNKHRARTLTLQILNDVSDDVFHGPVQICMPQHKHGRGLCHKQSDKLRRTAALSRKSSGGASKDAALCCMSSRQMNAGRAHPPNQIQLAQGQLVQRKGTTGASKCSPTYLEG